MGMIHAQSMQSGDLHVIENLPKDTLNIIGEFGGATRAIRMTNSNLRPIYEGSMPNPKIIASKLSEWATKTQGVQLEHVTVSHKFDSNPFPLLDTDALDRIAVQMAAVELFPLPSAIRRTSCDRSSLQRGRSAWRGY